MTKDEYIKEIEIARRYMDEFHLLADDSKIIMDCLFLPPFHWKAYYGQIFKEGTHYHFNCAYTFYADHLGLRSFSQSFSEAEKNNLHPSKKGDVICKTLIPEQSLIMNLTSLAESCNAATIDETGIIIDGVYAFIRLYENGKIVRELLLDNKPDELFDLLQRLSDEI